MKIPYERAKLAEHGVLILDRRLASRAKVEAEDIVAIRIGTVGDTFSSLCPRSTYRAAYHVQFDDVEADEPLAMTREDAKGIAEFIHHYKDSKFMIHCDAGISRSAAVALAIAQWSGNVELERAITSTPLFRPNIHVRESVLQELCYLDMKEER